MDAEIAPTVEGVRLDFRDAGRAHSTGSALFSLSPLVPICPAPETVRSSDLTITRGDGQPEVPVHVYRPAGTVARGAGVLFLHGGGFILGDLEHDHAACLRLASEVNCSVVSVDYRLAPEDRYPAAIEDCYTALTWMGRYCDDLGVDPERIAVGGSSAGGGLAASLAQEWHTTAAVLRLLSSSCCTRCWMTGRKRHP